MGHPTIDVYLPLLVKTGTKKGEAVQESENPHCHVEAINDVVLKSWNYKREEQSRTKEHMIEQIMNAYQQKLGIKGGNP